MGAMKSKQNYIFEIETSRMSLTENCSENSVLIREMEQNLFLGYEKRLQKLMQMVKTISEALSADLNTGALFYLNTEDMKQYRIDREMELIKDALLNEKQKLLIKLMTKCEELARKQKTSQQNQQEVSQPRVNRRNNSELLPSSPVKDKFDSDMCSHSRVSVLSSKMPPTPDSQCSQPSASVQVYEKLLQEKIIKVKQLEKINDRLQQEIVQSKRQFQAQIQQRNLKSKTQPEPNQNIQLSQSCQNCLETDKTLKKKNEELSSHQQQIAKLSTQLSQKKELISGFEQSISQAKQKLSCFQSHSEAKSQQIQSLRQQNSILQQQLQKVKGPRQEESKVQKNNSQTIKELKNRIIELEQNLMHVNDNFEAIKEDFGSTLRVLVTRAKHAHETLRRHVELSVEQMKAQASRSLLEAFEAIKLKVGASENEEAVAEALKKMDNELDYFVEKHNISTGC